MKKFSLYTDIKQYKFSDLADGENILYKIYALNMLQNFMDRALLNNAYELKIIHGVGTGVMKNEVKKMLKQYKDVREIWHPEPDQGGEGVTLVRF